MSGVVCRGTPPGNNSNIYIKQHKELYSHTTVKIATFYGTALPPGCQYPVRYARPTDRTATRELVASMETEDAWLSDRCMPSPSPPPARLRSIESISRSRSLLSAALSSERSSRSKSYLISDRVRVDDRIVRISTRTLTLAESQPEPQPEPKTPDPGPSPSSSPYLDPREESRAEQQARREGARHLVRVRVGVGVRVRAGARAGAKARARASRLGLG